MNLARSLWLKAWSGDSPQLRLCDLPLTGDHLFGPGLQDALERTADRKKAFPENKKKPTDRKKLCGQSRQQGPREKDKRPKKHWTGHKGRGEGGLA